MQHQKDDQTEVKDLKSLMDLLVPRADAAREAGSLFSQNIREFTGKGLNEPVNAWDVVAIFVKLQELKDAESSKQ